MWNERIITTIVCSKMVNMYMLVWRAFTSPQATSQQGDHSSGLPQSRAYARPVGQTYCQGFWWTRSPIGGWVCAARICQVCYLFDARISTRLHKRSHARYTTKEGTFVRFMGRQSKTATRELDEQHWWSLETVCLAFLWYSITCSPCSGISS